MSYVQQLKVARKLDASGAQVVGLMPNVWGNGKVYFVDSRSWGSGSDGNSGLDPNKPLAKIATAYGKCTSGNHDYIICLDGYDNDTATITIAKTALHIIGVDGANHRAPFVWLKVAGTGTAAVFTLQGGNSANVEIAGFTLGASSSKPCITTITGASTELVYGWIHHCAFAASLDAAFVAQDGILEAAGTGLDGTLIEDCTFGAQIGRDGIRFIDIYGGLIRNNRFMGIASGVAINQITGGHATGMPDIIDNKCFQAAATASGGFITTTDGGGGFIDGNVCAEDATGTCGNNPYLEGTGACAWGVNWKGYAVTLPA